MAHQDQRDAATDPSAPPPPLLRGWMLTATDDRVLLSLRPPFLVVPAPGLPDGVQLRVRAAPEGNAAEASRSLFLSFWWKNGVNFSSSGPARPGPLTRNWAPGPA